MSHPTHDSTTRTETETFERALTTLVLESFARGADIEGTWEITPASELAPNWRVAIEQTSTATLPADGDDFIDE